MSLKPITILEAYKQYVEEKRALGISENTLKTYDLHIQSFLRCCDCYNNSYDVYFGYLDKNVWVDYIQYLKETGNKKDVTITSYCRSVRAFLYWAMDNNYMEETALKLPKYEKTIKETYTQEEIAKLLEKPEKGCSEVTYQTWVFINLIMSTGLRLSSALNLKVYNYVRQEHLLYIQTTKQKKGQQLYLNAEVCSILNKYIKLFDLEETDYLFGIATKEIMKRRTMEDYVAEYNRSRGVEKTSIHLMRHTYAKNYYNETKDIYSLQQILGHSTISTTETYLRDLGLTAKNSTAYNPQRQFLNVKEDKKNKRRSRKMQ